MASSRRSQAEPLPIIQLAKLVDLKTFHDQGSDEAIQNKLFEVCKGVDKKHTEEMLSTGLKELKATITGEVEKVVHGKVKKQVAECAKDFDGKALGERIQRQLADSQQQIQRQLADGQQQLADGQQQLQRQLADGQQQLQRQLADGQQQIQRQLADGQQQLQRQLDDQRKFQQQLADGQQQLQRQLDDQRKVQQQLEDGQRQLADDQHKFQQQFTADLKATKSLMILAFNRSKFCSGCCFCIESTARRVV
jgi:uncharacterized phage infection (PIP) family protein YhgE